MAPQHYGRFYTKVMWSTLNKPWCTFSYSLIQLGWCESSYKLSDSLKALTQMLSDNHILQLFAVTYRNNNVFQLFSKRMVALGLNHTVDQCCVYVKKTKLQLYIKVYDLESILDTRTTTRPKRIVESFEEEMTPHHQWHQLKCLTAPQIRSQKVWLV